MKVIVLGGAGVMGSRAVEDLAASEGVETITVADRDDGSARALVDAMPPGAAKIEVARVDAGDHASLVSAMKGHDLAASALGPFYRFESRLISAALEAGIHYVSICDDWSATLDAFMRFDGPAREKGLTVVTGSGASPGLTNVGIRYLAGRLDSVEKADVYVYVPIDSPEGEATIMHALFVYGITVPVFRDGTTQMIPAGAESRRVAFPVAGEVRVWNCGHSEPVTLPRYFPALKEMNMMMGLGTGTGPLVWAGRLGAYKSPGRREWLSRNYVRLTGSAKREAPELEGAVRIDVTGVLDGRATTLTGCGTATMRDSTGLALSVGAQLTGAGRLTATGGVFAPEGCFDPDEFLSMMAQRGVYIHSDLAMKDRLVG